MASISSLTGTGSSSSIYGSRNVISGLASGLDTETLIENAVKGYQTKIQSLQQKQTQVQWKQDAYRSIIDKMVNLNRKYTSYTSSTNLFSQSFFNNAVTTSVLGDNASAVSATGRATSDVRINGIKSLATSARYSTGVDGIAALANNVGHIDTVTNKMVTTGVEGIDLAGDVTIGKLSGGMNITYGSNSVYLNFTEKDVYKNAEEMAKGIEEKLGDALVKTGSGDYVKASERIGVKVDGDKISFFDKSSAGNSVYIGAADKGLQSQLGVTPGKDAKSFSIKPEKLTEDKNVAEYLSDKSLNVTFNGTSKTIDLKDFKTKVDDAYDEALTKWENDSENEGKELTDEIKASIRKKATEDTFKETVQEGLDKAFGSGKVTFDLAPGEDGKSKLSFSTGTGDTLSVTSTADKALGLGENGLSSYLNLKTKLKDVFTEPFGYKTKDDVDESEIAESIDEIGKNGKKYVLNADGDLVDKDGVRVPKTKKLTVNGEEFEFGEDTTIESLINKINNNKDAGVNISYSNLTNKFAITSTETGTSGKIEMKGELASLFGFDDDGKVDGKELADSGLYTAGTDAVFNVTVNGDTMELTRSSNTVDFDGMSVTLNKAFGYEKELDPDGKPVMKDGQEVWKPIEDTDPIRFSTKTDSDKIVDAIQSFVNDYNEMVTEIRKQYATQPAEKSSTNHTRYMPLTDADKEGMSDDAIAAYEEKAKQGILFGETELSSLHSALRDAITGNSLSGSYTDNAEYTRMLRDIGITTEYSGGLTTLSLDAGKLRSALDNDPNSVRDVFAQTTENGASTDGLMQRVQKVLNQYANTSSGSPGILIQRAGSQYAPLSINNNALQDQYDRYTEQIEKIQDTISNRIDYYTKQFTALEQMMMQMNSQSSALAGLMGGSGSY